MFTCILRFITTKYSVNIDFIGLSSIKLDLKLTLKRGIKWTINTMKLKTILMII